jgi:uncharacterized protein (DUF302 family)
VLEIWMAIALLTASEEPIIFDPENSIVLEFPEPDWENRGFIPKASPYSLEETANRLEAASTAQDLTILSHFIVRLSGAPTRSIHLTIPDLAIAPGCNIATTPNFSQTVLIWQERDNQVWIAYNGEQNLADRYNLTDCDAELRHITQVLNRITADAIAPDS